uniref:Arginine--tRNA ligase n=1 Tax=Thermodesulfobacterium geofontis TaxID=1295609 RepID=A0A7V5XG86_9BACT
MIKRKIKELIEGAIKELFGEIGGLVFEIERPKKEIYGDYATNVALVLKNKLNLSPMEIANKLASKLREKTFIFSQIDIVNPGFINFWIAFEYYVENLKKILELKDEYGKIDLGKGKKVLIEFVSANPTGPLHIGHGRGAAYGDSLARLLKFTGYKITKEYYINDKGTQMDILGESVYLRAKELSGESIQFPENYYKGKYIYDIAKEALKLYSDLLSMKKERAVKICKELAIKLILEDIKKDLENFRVFYDNWYLESSLYENSKVDRVLGILKEKGLIYEKEGALWFKATFFGDEKDRVLIRSKGEATYFAGDIAYHYEKFMERNFDIAINIWGADHHGYINRLKAAMQAFEIDPEKLKVLLIQMVNLIESGEKKSMSTREGEFLELKELVREVGVDATRFIFLSRSADSPLDFDIELAKKQSQENPVYYVQYAHARICSVFEKAKESGIDKVSWENMDFKKINEKEEIELLKKFEEFQEVIESASHSLAPYKITYYLLELAKQFHEYYSKHRILSEDLPLTYARLGLCLACKIILKNGLELLGVSAPKKM